MIRPEARRRVADPAAVNALAAARAEIARRAEAVLALSSRQAARELTGASRARQAQAHASRARLEGATELGRRPPDRAFFVRPLLEPARSLWDHENLRAWYRGGTTGSLAGSDFAGASLGATTGASGYTTTARMPPPHNPFDGTVRGGVEGGREVALNEARARALAKWRAAANAAPWIDRDAVLRVERDAARDMLGATGWEAGQVEAGRPFLSRTAAEDAWRFKAPRPADLRDTMNAARAEATPRALSAPSSARATALAMLTSRGGDYGLGET